MRDIEAIDADLRLLSCARLVARDLSERLLGEQPSEPTPTSERIDQLLDERAAAER
jgi:hypothetical protein